jgi:hypothetical protein
MLEQARELAARIMATWSGGPTGEVWIEELVLLEEGTAGTTFVRLRRELDRAPSIKRFLEMYRSLDTRPVVRVECSLCEGEGWRPDTGPGIHGPGCPRRRGAQECHCTGYRPCICAAGAEREPVYRSIKRTNDWKPPEAERQGEMF